MNRMWSDLLARLPAAVALLVTAATSVAAADTEKVEAVEAGQKLELRNYNGSVLVRAGAADQLRVRATHPSGEAIVIERRGRSWLVVPASWKNDSGAFRVNLPNVGVVRIEGAEPPAVAFEVEVPEWMPVVIEAPRGDVTVRATRAAVEVTTMLGSIELEGGRDTVRLQSMNGRIDVRGAAGRLRLESTRYPVTVTGCDGDIRVETTAGDVTLVDLDAVAVEVKSVDGNLELRSRLRPGAPAELITHSGDIVLATSRSFHADLSLRAFRGEIGNGLGVTLPDGTREADLVIGDGGARIELQTFSGRISLVGTDGR